MQKFKNKFANAAAQIFAEHKDIDFVYVTSDGNGFTKDQEHNAHEHARVLHNKTVEAFERGFEDDFEDDEDEPKKPEQKADDNGERAELAAKYEKLFGKKPNHMTGVEKLKSQIAEKEAELAAANQATVNKPEGQGEGAE